MSANTEHEITQVIQSERDHARIFYLSTCQLMRDPHTPIFAAPWTVYLCGPMKRSDGDKTIQAVNMPINLEKRGPSNLIVTANAKGSDG